MSTIQEIETAVTQLSAEQFAVFRAWFAEYNVQAFRPQGNSQDAWEQFAAQNLARAYGEDEPAYSATDLKQPNPDYAGS